MNFQFYAEKLKASEEFKKFIEENKDAFFASGFFVMDFENSEKPDNKQHFDYFIPGKNKMFSFQVEENCKKVPVEIVDKGFKEVALNHSFDFDKIHEIIRDKMIEKEVKNKIQRILLSLQNKDGKDFLIGTIFVSQLGLVKVDIDLTKMQVIGFEKKSFFDILKITGKKK